MTIFRRAIESRGLNDPTVPLTATSLVDWLQGSINDSGIIVTEKNAFTMPAVYRAVSMIAGACAGIPLVAYDRKDKLSVVDSLLLDQPNLAMTPYEFWEHVYVCLLVSGNFYGRKNYDGLGRVISVDPISPNRVKVGTSSKAVTDNNPSGKLFSVGKTSGGEGTYTPHEILHIPGMGYDGVCGVSPVRLAAQGIGMALAAEKYSAKQFSNGTLISGLLQTEQRVTEEQADELAARWRSKVAGVARAHDIAVLGSGVKFQPIQFSGQDVQMMESRKFQVVEIARIFGIPPHMLGDVEKSTSWGTGIEQQTIGFVTYALKPWLNRVEQRVSLDLLPTSQFARHDLDELMRGDSAQRAAYYTAMRNIGVLSADDVRAAEGMTPLPDGKGQEYMNPLNMAPAGMPLPTNGGPDGTTP